MKRPRLVAPSLVDRLVGVFSPAAQLRRQVARTALASANGGYNGGKRDRRGMQNYLPDGGSANTDTSPDLPMLRARSRDLRRNVPLATGAIATRITNVIGEGLRVLPQVDGDALGLSKKAARDWNRKARAEFALACWTADFTGVNSFDELQALVFGSAEESGDVLVIRRYRRDPGDTYGVKLQVIEADRLSNPNNHMDSDTIVGGVEASGDGVVLAYHVSDRHPGDTFRKAMSWRRIPAFYNDGRPICLHIFKRLRPDQARGVPFLSPVIEAFKQLGTYSEAEIEAAVLAAFFTVFVKTPDGQSGPLASTGEDLRSGKETVGLGKGAIVDLAEGEDIVIANPSRPNQNFDPFVLAILKQIGAALELPFELLIKHFSASYSASRAALEMAWQTFRRERAWIIRNLCQPYYEMVLEEAIVMGRIEAPGFFDDPAIRRAWLNAAWYGPVKMSLDPKKDADADAGDLANRTKTRSQIIMERTGGDIESVFEQLGYEAKLAEENGLSSGAKAPMAGPAEDGSGNAKDNPEPEKEDDNDT
ncbi:phage portal protein [Rhizobium sp. Leaf386]|uniref:phage portal protein n=1 Tax=Rhizobium sp. Leaf386 TaxID=1736359 RepID=UPI00071455C3|nr:phage portal protein [Rhizobium sp. Leaf386]KQS90307.1 hypothetical protein ASG50_07575 [Rhizobium sp. Leaf386]